MASMAEETSILEIAHEQKIHNENLKAACLEQEDFIHELVANASRWIESQESKLIETVETANQLLESASKGTKWMVVDPMSTQKLVRMLNLSLTPQEMYKAEAKARTEGLVEQRKRLASLKSHLNCEQYVNFTDTLADVEAVLTQLEEDVGKSPIDGSALAALLDRTIFATEDVLKISPAVFNLISHDEEIAALKMKIEKVNEIRDVALADGEMAIAEEQFHAKAALLEQLIDLVRDKLRILAVSEEEMRVAESHFKQNLLPYEKFHAGKDINNRMKNKSDADIAILDKAIMDAELADAQALQSLAYAKERSEKALKDNEDKQAEAWKKMREAQRQLELLSQERTKEIQRALDEAIEEEKRKVDHQELLRAIATQRSLLDDSLHHAAVIDNAMKCIERAVDQMQSCLKTRLKKTNSDLAEYRLSINQQYLDTFRRLYKTFGQLVFKKEKKIEDIDHQIRAEHMQLEFTIETFDPNAKKHSAMKKKLYELRAINEEELQVLKDKITSLDENFVPTAEALRMAGVEFIHPSEEVEEGNLQRRSKIVEYKTHLVKYQEVKLAAKQEEIRKAKLLINGSPSGRPAIDIRRDPYSPALQPPGSAKAATTSLPAGSPTGNPRRTLSGLSPSTKPAPVDPLIPTKKWKADVMDNTIFYDFVDDSTLMIDFTSAGFLVQHATFEMDTTKDPIEIDIHLPSSSTTTGESIPAQTQKMLYKRLGPHSFQLQMNTDSSQRPLTFHEGTSVVFTKA